MARKAPFVVISGTENFYLDREVEKARATRGRQIISLDAEDGLDGSELVDVCETRGFDSDSRLVLVDHAESVKFDEVLTEYTSSKDPEDTSVVLVAVVRSEKLSSNWDKVAVLGKHLTFKSLKPWEHAKKIDRIEAEAALLGLTFEKDAPALLLSFVGDDLYVIHNELRKLAILLGQGGKITAKHLSLVVAPQPPASPFEVADAAAEKNLKRAMNLVSHLYRYMGEGASVPIASALIRSVERLLVVRAMLDAGRTPEEIAGRLAMHIFRLKNSFLVWAERHTTDSLKRNFAELCQLDADVKSAARSKRTLVELAVKSIAA